MKLAVIYDSKSGGAGVSDELRRDEVKAGGIERREITRCS